MVNLILMIKCLLLLGLWTLFIPHLPSKGGIGYRSDLLGLLAPYPFPLPSRKVAIKVRENTQHKGQGFPAEEKEWEINYFRPKAIIFWRQGRHLLAKLSRCYKKIKGSCCCFSFCHLKSVSGSQKKKVLLFSLWFLIRFLNRLPSLKKKKFKGVKSKVHAANATRTLIRYHSFSLFWWI